MLREIEMFRCELKIENSPFVNVETILFLRLAENSVKTFSNDIYQKLYFQSEMN